MKSSTYSLVQSFFPNTTLPEVKTKEWQEFHTIIGDSLFYFILTQCLIFLRIEKSNSEYGFSFYFLFSLFFFYLLGKQPENNLMQLCGAPVSEYMRLKKAKSVPLKKRQLPKSSQTRKKEKKMEREKQIQQEKILKRKRLSKRKRTARKKQKLNEDTENSDLINTPTTSLEENLLPLPRRFLSSSILWHFIHSRSRTNCLGC